MALADIFETIQLLEKHPVFSSVLKFEIQSKTIEKVNKPELSEKHVLRNLIISPKTAVLGFPEMRILRKVFLRNQILSPFRLFGLAKPRMKIVNAQVNRKFDLIYDTRYKQEVKREQESLFKASIDHYFEQISGSELSVDFNFFPTGIYAEVSWYKEKCESELLYPVCEIIRTILLQENKNTELPHAFRRIKIFSCQLSPSLANEVVCNYYGGLTAEWEYPKLWKQFIGLISKEIWLDENYSEKPVVQWLGEINKAEIANWQQVKSIFTFIVRQKRFCEGFWKSLIQENTLPQIIQKIAAAPFSMAA